ncbi:MAG: hypothetical protein INR65_14570 [Gluconacetobacter diazotrophicus]|nr:hypothetical protein [Gluconacetobacter diazotrophicus]
MFSALLYLQFQTVKNRLLERLRRLRRPRYFFGALAGGLYLLLVFARPIFFATHPGFGGGRHPLPALLPEVSAGVWEFVAALALAVVLLLAWLLPHERAALIFTEAEIAFLFPAPIRRRTLIHYKLLRSQLAVFFTSIFFALFSRWSGGVGGALLRAAGFWLLLSTLNLHLLGASFARTLLLEHGVTTWRRRGLILAVLVALGAGAVWWTRGQVPPLEAADTESIGAFARYVQTIANTAPAYWLLLPFRVAVRPFLASGDAAAFGAAVGPALLLLGLHYLWVVWSDVAFEEASIAASQRHAVRTAAMRSGNWQNARPARKRRAPFRLAPTGPPAVAILWKNLLGAGQFFNARLAIAFIAYAAIAGSAFGSTGGGQGVWVPVVGTMCIFLLGMTLLFGPQIVRQDFRRDLAAADLLKIYPLRGWQVALGELLAPALILTVVEWVLIVLAATLLHGGSALPFHPERRAAAALAAALLCPTFNVVSLLIPNAAALLMPAWFATPDTPGATANSRGIEVIGQRLLFLLAQVAALALALLPAGATFFLVYLFAAKPYLPDVAVLPAAAVAATLVFAGEAAGGLALLGSWFESYDVSAERI